MAIKLLRTKFLILPQKIAILHSFDGLVGDIYKVARLDPLQR